MVDELGRIRPSGSGDDWMVANKKLRPTLWRTCRALMNDARLELFRAVVEHNDELNVSELARLVNVSQPAATIALRLLQSRGLIGVRRERLSVFYNLSKDRSLPEAAVLQDAFIEFFAQHREGNDWKKEVLVVLKAFTHFNRLAAIVRLSKSDADKETLAKSMGVVVKTFEHHLRYLVKARIVGARGEPGKPSMYRLLPQSHPIAKTLLDLLLADGRTFYNDARGTEENLRLLRDSSGIVRVVDVGQRSPSPRKCARPVNHKGKSH